MLLTALMTVVADCRALALLVECWVTEVTAAGDYDEGPWCCLEQE